MKYDELCSFGNLFLAYRKARKGKTGKWYVKKFEKNLEKNLILLEHELRTMNYHPRPMKSFVIRDPKSRVISSSHFRDRIVHHAVCNIIEPIFERSFIHDSYASRRGKGTHAALRRLDEFKRKVSRNGRLLKSAKDENCVIGYVLKADVKHYFETVDHAVLLSILRKKIHDEKIVMLIEKILANHSDREGMPLGAMTSQFFANVYLNELDYFVKRKLRAKFYIRYLDDFVILHNDRRVLELWKASIDAFLKMKLKLELHKDKSKIYPLSAGINFLGFRVFYKYKLLKKSNMRQIAARLSRFDHLYEDGILDESEILSSIYGWNAYAMHANTYKFRKKISKTCRRIFK